MASNDTILLLWRIPKMKWRISWVLTKNSKMPKNQSMSKFAQNRCVWPSTVLGNMFWSKNQNMKFWSVFFYFPCRTLPFSLLELVLGSLVSYLAFLGFWSKTPEIHLFILGIRQRRRMVSLDAIISWAEPQWFSNHLEIILLLKTAKNAHFLHTLPGLSADCNFLAFYT